VLSFLLAQSTSDNSPAGQNFTLWFPAGLFIIVAAILYLLYSRPHQRVPPRRPMHAHASSVGVAASQGAPATSAAAAPAADPAPTSATDEPAEPGDAGTGAGE
jgi:hypothetical protein